MKGTSSKAWCTMPVGVDYLWVGLYDNCMAMPGTLCDDRSRKLIRWLRSSDQCRLRIDYMQLLLLFMTIKPRNWLYECPALAMGFM